MSEQKCNINIDYITEDELNKMPLFENIRCPVLRLGVRSRKLVMDSSGNVTVEALYNFMAFIGIDRNARVIKRVIDRAKTKASSKSINITEFKGLPFDHGSVSGIFRPEVLQSTKEVRYSKQALTAFISMSRDKENMDLDDFAEATNRFHQCPFKKMKTSLFGVVASTFEFALLLHFLGRTSNSGTKFLTLEDIKRIWGESKFPRYWTSPQKAEFGTLGFIVKTLVFGWLRLDLKVKSCLKSLNFMAAKVRDNSEREI